MSNLVKIESGERAAEYFKYFLQYTTPDLISNPIPLKRIRAGQLYKKSPEVWDKLVDVFTRHNLDLTLYLKFLVNELRFNCRTECSAIIAPETLRKYQSHIESTNKRKYAFDQFKKTVDRLSDICIDEKINSAVDCLKTLIKSRRLVSLYVAGQVSRYYLAAIVNFNKIIPKLDPISRSEFKDIMTRYEIYNTEINQAFLFYKNRKADPFRSLDDAIAAKKQKTSS